MYVNFALQCRHYFYVVCGKGFEVQLSCVHGGSSHIQRRTECTELWTHMSQVCLNCYCIYYYLYCYYIVIVICCIYFYFYYSYYVLADKIVFYKLLLKHDDDDIKSSTLMKPVMTTK